MNEKMLGSSELKLFFKKNTIRINITNWSVNANYFVLENKTYRLANRSYLELKFSTDWQMERQICEILGKKILIRISWSFDPYSILGNQPWFLMLTQLEPRECMKNTREKRQTYDHRIQGEIIRWKNKCKPNQLLA